MRSAPSILAGLLAVLCALCALPVGLAHEMDASKVQAAFLYRFLFFLKDQPLEQPDGEMCLGVLGPDPYGPFLDEIDGRAIHGNRVRVRRFGTSGEVGNCELVFISPEVKGGVSSSLRALTGQKILTVSTQDGFARQGGIVELGLQNERVRFDLNRTAATRNGLRLSAELLEVARKIYP